MIAGVSRHARTQRESRALISHLLKPENNPRTMILGGTLATDLSGAVADMQRLRDSTSADAAALHIYLSPSRAMTDDELARAAEIVREHLGAADHAAALVVHDKERRSGEGHSHAHLVLGRVSPSGVVLESGFEKIKLETASRLIEFELGEEPVLGRHHASAVRWLRQHGRADVADWLTAAHGPYPDKPQSAASPAHRQALSRQGLDLSECRNEIRGAWKEGGADAVREAGYSIESGRKSGVFVVGRDGVEIGALDRIVDEKRDDVRNAMEAAPVQISRKESISDGDQSPRKPVQRDSGPVAGDPSSEKSEKFRPERSGLGTASAPLRGKKKTGAEQVSEAAADQARRLAETFGGHLDAAFTKASAHRWIKDRRTTLKGQILESSQSPDAADARREIARSRRELAVLDAASDALRADPSLAFGGEKALMGAARRLHAERTAATRDEIRIAWESGGVAAVRAAGYEIAPGRDGAWRVLRDGVPIGTLHRLIGVSRDDSRQAMGTDVEVVESVRLIIDRAVTAGGPADARRLIARERNQIQKFVEALAVAEFDPDWEHEEVRSRAQVDLLTAELADLDTDPQGWLSGARKRSFLGPDAEKASKSRQARTSGKSQPSGKPAESVLGSAKGDPSSGKPPRRRSPDEAAAAAGRFLYRVEADLRGRIAELSRPDKLPEPAELSDARRRLSVATRERASWDDRHGSRITELRLRTGRERPTGVLAWVSGATARWDQASRELDALFEDREPLRRAKAETTRALRILQTAQETRQVVHDDARNQKRERLSKTLSLVPDARAALAEDPTIANGGRKALAAAARRHQAARLAEERRADQELGAGGYTPGGGYGG